MKWTCKLESWNGSKIDANKELAKLKKKKINKTKTQKNRCKKQTCKTKNKEKGEQNTKTMQQRTCKKIKKKKQTNKQTNKQAQQQPKSLKKTQTNSRKITYLLQVWPHFQTSTMKCDGI